MPGNSFLSVFAKSPLKPIEQHIDAVDACCQLLLPFFEAVLASDWPLAEQHLGEITRLEKQADSIKYELRMQLPSGLFMPVKRRDLLELLIQQDKLASQVKRLSTLVIHRKLSLPSPVHTAFKQFLLASVDSTNQAKVVVHELDSLLETGFKGREVSLVENMITELDKQEDKVHELEQIVLDQLQQHEVSMAAVDAVHSYKVVEQIGLLADTAEQVAMRLEIMLAE